MNTSTLPLCPPCLSLCLLSFVFSLLSTLFWPLFCLLSFVFRTESGLETSLSCAFWMIPIDQKQNFVKNRSNTSECIVNVWINIQKGITVWKSCKIAIGFAFPNCLVFVIFLCRTIFGIFKMLFQIISLLDPFCKLR